ncbi:MAG: ATP-binding protein [Brumimicrobium sp.]
MLQQAQISSVIDAQRELFLQKDGKLLREALTQVPAIENFATIITGIRRCGKSTLLLQVLKKNYEDALYLNFEDIRLTGFETSDFVRLKKEIEQRKLKVLFFDEIQLVEKWEIFIHQLLNEGYTVFVTGSNASLLSKEMGTHLTGRHLSMELFPFSFSEYLSYKKINSDEKALSGYLQTGGMPEYVKNNQPQIITNLIDDIVVRDIAVRYATRNVDSLKQLLVYLISNVGSPVSANKLMGMFGIKSTTTILEYFAYFTDTYLLEFLPQFSYSLKAQARNPKKIYAMDTGFIDAVSLSFTEDMGRKLENLVFLHFRRMYRDIYFFKEKKECDFVVFDRGQVQKIVQVCYNLNDENFDREYSGLLEAMQFFDQKEGFIVTLDQKDHFEKDGFSVRVIPAFEFVK